MYETSFVDGKAGGKHVIYYGNGGVKREGNAKRAKKKGYGVITTKRGI